MTAYLAGLATAAAFNWLRWHHIRIAAWFARTLPDIIRATKEPDLWA